jgi:hypothetical protein
MHHGTNHHDQRRLARCVTSIFSTVTPESRGDLAYKIAVYLAEQDGMSAPWAKELRNRVRQRILWAKPPD